MPKDFNTVPCSALDNRFHESRGIRPSGLESAVVDDEGEVEGAKLRKVSREVEKVVQRIEVVAVGRAGWLDEETKVAGTEARCARVWMSGGGTVER
jgi:hypothetical protein